MKILIAEDESKLAQSLKKGLEENNLNVDIARDGSEALSMAQEGNYDVILMDVLMPEKSGFEVLKELRAHAIHTPVLFLTAKSSIMDRVEGLNLGADDYIVKPFAFSEVLARIYSVHRRRRNYKDLVYRHEDLTLDVSGREVRRGDRKIDLRPKEFMILQYLMEHRGRVVTRTMLLEHIWDYAFVSGSNLIDVHIKRLREKLDSGSTVKIIKTIKGVGYTLG